jgi:F-type H+-transporting ATPase subunit b
MFHFGNVALILLSEEGHKPSLLDVNPGLIIWTIIIFVILLGILYKIAWKPMLKALNTREETIKTALDNAEKQNKNSAELMEQNKKSIAETNAQAMGIINESKEAAVKIKNDIIEKANEEYRKMMENTRKEIESQKDAAIENMKSEIVNISIKAAEKILSETLDAAKQKKIVDDFISQIPKN